MTHRHRPSPGDRQAGPAEGPKQLLRLLLLVLLLPPPNLHSIINPVSAAGTNDKKGTGRIQITHHVTGPLQAAVPFMPADNMMH